MEDYEIKEELLQAIESAEHMMRTMSEFDSGIPEAARRTLREKAAELDKLVDKYA